MFPFQISNLLGFIKTNNFSCSSAIDEKLNKPNCSLEELLDEEEIIQEMKYQNIKLLNFFDKEKVKQLLEYILIEPKEDEFKRGHRYPFIASEILNSDSNKIYDLFFDKSNVNKNSIDSSQKKSIDITDKKGKENDMDTFSFEEKKDCSSTKENFNVNAESNPILEEIPLTSSQEKQEVSVNGLPKTEKIESKLEELHIKQDVDINMNIDDKQSSNCLNPENVNSNQIENSSNQVEDKIEVDEDTHTISNQSNEHNESNDPKEDIRMTKETLNQDQIKTEEKKEIDLLDYFLSFLNNNQPLNYVLCGYFAKLFNTLLNKNSNYVIHYIWEKRPDVLNKLLYHCNRKSLAELLVRLIQIETIDVELSHQQWVKELRHKFLSEFVLKLRSEDLEEVDNTIWVLSDIIDNRSLLEFAFENKTFLRTLIENISSKDVKNLNFVETINLVILVNKFCWVENFQMPVYAQSTDETLVSYNEKEIIHSELSQLTKNNLLFILNHFINENDNNDNNIWETTFGSSYKPLGNKRIKVLEYLLTVFNLMKTAIHEIDNILVDKQNANFFPTLFNLFFQYEWNSFYQQNFEGVINFIFNNTQGFPQTIKYLFEEFSLINYLLEKSKNPQFTFNSNRKMNHGFWANYIELCSKINSVNDPEVTKHFTDEWKQFVKDKVEYWKNLFSRQLSAVVKNNFSFNFEDKQDFQNNVNSNTNYGFENTAQEENKTSEYKPQNATDFFNNLGTSNDAEWPNSFPKESTDSSKFDKELENFEFYEDKKTETHNENQVKEVQIENPQRIDEEVIKEEKEKPQENQGKSENDLGNLENGISSDSQKKNEDIFSFDENCVQRKEELANEVDKMLNQINN